MEDFVLKARHYQIFLSLGIPGLLVAFVPDFNPNVPLIKIIFMGLASSVWIFTLGRALNSCLPRRKQLNETFLVVNLFSFAIIFTLIIIFSDFNLRFFGSAVLIPLYMLFSILYLYYFAAKALTTNEKGTRTSLGDHVGEMLLLMSGVLGIWVVQPRINKIYHQQQLREKTAPEPEIGG